MESQRSISIIGPSTREIQEMQKENNDIMLAMESFMEKSKIKWHEAWDIVIEKGTRKVKDEYRIY